FSARRDLREQAFSGWVSRGSNGGDTDNLAIVQETLALRHEKAKLLGYEDFAAFKLENSMAKTSEAVNELLLRVWKTARDRALKEEKDLADLIADEGENHTIMPWDWRYYAEKLRQITFKFSESELKPYLQLENVIKGCFDVA